MGDHAFPDLYGRGRDDRFWSADRQSKKLFVRCGSTVRYLHGLFRSDLDGLQRQGCSGYFHHRRCRRPDFHFPCGKTGADGYHGADRGGGIFLYVSGADHPAAHYETVYNQRRASDQDGAASSGFQTGKDLIPDHRYDRGMYDPSHNSSPGWYADAG